MTAMMTITIISNDNTNDDKEEEGEVGDGGEGGEMLIVVEGGNCYSLTLSLPSWF